MKCIVCGADGIEVPALWSVPTGDGRNPDIHVHLWCAMKERAFWNKAGEFLDNKLASMAAEERSKK